MMIQVGPAMINVYQKVLCAKENVQKVMANVATSVCPLVKCKIITLAIHNVFLMTFLTSIIGHVMGHA